MKASTPLPENRRRGRPRSAIRDTLRTVEILLLIIYGALLAISRTDGFRSLLARRFERSFGGAVWIGKSKLTPGLSLVLQDVRFRWPDANSRDAARIREARLKFGWTGGWNLPHLSEALLLEPALHLELLSGGKPVVPAATDLTLGLHRMGWPVPEIHSQSESAPEEFWNAMDLSIRIRKGSVSWVEADGTSWLIGDIHGEILPLRFDRRRFRYVDLTAGNMPREEGKDPTPNSICVLLDQHGEIAAKLPDLIED